MMAWFTGTATPLILMLIGAPTEMKMSEAFFSDITWNSRFIADIVFILIAAQQFVEAGLRACLCVDLFYDHRTVQAVLAVRRGQSTRNHDRPRGNATVEDLARSPVENPGALAEEHPHGNHAIFLDDHAFHDLRARPDEA